MKISRTRFVCIFLVCAFVFQFISNALLGSAVRLFPVDGEYFPGTGSPVMWKCMLAAIVWPLKIVLIGPLLPLFKLPDPPPPLLALAFAAYWTLIALVLYVLFTKISARKKRAH